MSFFGHQRDAVGLLDNPDEQMVILGRIFVSGSRSDIVHELFMSWH